MRDVCYPTDHLGYHGEQIKTMDVHKYNIYILTCETPKKWTHDSNVVDLPIHDAGDHNWMYIGLH